MQRRLWLAWCLMVVGMSMGAAMAQVSKPTADEARLSVYDIPGGAAFRSDGLSKQPGLADPRDFTGTWNNQLGNALEGFLRLRAAQARGQDGPAAAAGAGGPPDGAAPPGGGGPAGGPGPGNQSYKKACMPTVGPTSGGDGPVEIIQTADELTWMSEEMHAIRRVFLKGTFTPELPDSYGGESVGHFDGDTLVVETRGMKGLGAGVRLIERLSKSDEGRVLHDRISYVDAAGQSTGADREMLLYYRPNEKMMEWICEDNGQLYQPGVYGRDL